MTLEIKVKRTAKRAYLSFYCTSLNVNVRFKNAYKNSFIADAAISLTFAFELENF